VTMALLPDTARDGRPAVILPYLLPPYNDSLLANYLAFHLGRQHPRLVTHLTCYIPSCQSTLCRAWQTALAAIQAHVPNR
jgi:hypothetical protein